MKIIKTVGVIGAGTMGSALAQKFAMEGFSVILLDTTLEFVNKGLQRIKETLDEGIEKKIFTPEKAEKILSQIHASTELSVLSKSELVIEAIFEDFDAKSELFKKLDKILSSDTIVATNTSSFSVTELAKNISYPERFIGVHYFYHAAKNRLVEIIPGKDTSPGTFNAMQVFSIQSGKDAITCKDAYGFVVNRFFVPWLNESVRLLEEGIASTGEIDAVCMKTLSIGMGPFALMNATGVPVAYHAEKTLEHYGKLYETANPLKLLAEKKESWNIDTVDESAVKAETKKIINDRLLGVIFFVCSQLLDEKVCSAVEINRGARIGLAWRRGPIDLMRKYGEEEVRKLIAEMAQRYGEKIPKSIGDAFWKMDLVTLFRKGENAVITINRPEDMNALNENVIKQLETKFNDAESDPEVKTIFITGSGKAFVAGADIKFFVDNIKSKSIDKIVKFTEYCQSVYDRIDKSKKKVVTVLNGLALGGGLELALCGDMILALPDAVLAYPETGIGIYPGLGGTQRTQKRIGKAFTKYMIFTGDMLNAQDAYKLRLVDVKVNINDIFKIFEGSMPLPDLVKKPVLDEKFINIRNFFSHYVFGTTGVEPESETAAKLYEKLMGKIKYKAPLAVKTAEMLIDECKGCSSELEHLSYIFKTEDALLGLSSIGKKIEYKGR